MDNNRTLFYKRRNYLNLICVFSYVLLFLITLKSKIRKYLKSVTKAFKYRLFLRFDPNVLRVTNI